MSSAQTRLVAAVSYTLTNFQCFCGICIFYLFTMLLLLFFFTGVEKHFWGVVKKILEKLTEICHKCYVAGYRFHDCYNTDGGHLLAPIHNPISTLYLCLTPLCNDKHLMYSKLVICHKIKNFPRRLTLSVSKSELKQRVGPFHVHFRIFSCLNDWILMLHF